MSWEDLSPAQWRMLDRIRDNPTPTIDFNDTDMKTAECLARHSAAQWVEIYSGAFLTITFAGRVALRLHKELEASK